MIRKKSNLDIPRTKNWNKYSTHKYNPNYPLWFKEEKNNLIKLIPYAKIEHVGSTSIVGLGGKSLIDIAILVPPEKIKESKKKLASLEYSEWTIPKSRKYYSFAKYHAKRKFHIHITSNKLIFQTHFIFFRDYLLKHRNLIEEYSNLKKKAVKEVNVHAKSYMDIKRPFIKRINQEARKEFLK